MCIFAEADGSALHWLCKTQERGFMLSSAVGNLEGRLTIRQRRESVLEADARSMSNHAGPSKVSRAPSNEQSYHHRSSPHTASGPADLSLRPLLPRQAQNVSDTRTQHAVQDDSEGEESSDGDRQPGFGTLILDEDGRSLFFGAHAGSDWLREVRGCPLPLTKA